MTRIKWLLPSVLILVHAASAQGSIEGTVTDERGRPIAAAHVHIAETRPSYGSKVLQFYETDAQGRFRIEFVRWGTYGVMAGKEESGYPDTKMKIYAPNGVPTVTISPASRLADVMVRLGPKAAILRIPRVVAADDAAPVKQCSVTIRLLRNPAIFMRASATQQKLLLPANEDLLLEISAPGYAAWPRAAKGLRLRPQETLTIEPRLRRLTGVPPKESAR